LAIITGVQHYHEYLVAKEFLIRTDNIALKYLNSMKHATGRLGRWNMLLSGYKYRIEHTKGKDNIPADRLSRIPSPAPTTGLEEKFEEMLMSVDRESTDNSPGVWEITLAADIDEEAAEGTEQASHEVSWELSHIDNIAEMQASCPEVGKLVAYIKDGILPNDDAEARKLVYESERYACTQDGVLWHLHLPRNKRQRDVDIWGECYFGLV